MRRTATLALAVPAAVLAGVAARHGVVAFLAVGLVVLAAATFAGPAAAAATRPEPEVDRMARLASGAWLVLCLLPVHNFIQRANRDAVNQVGLEPVFEVTYFAVIGILAVAILRRLEPDATRARPPVVLFLLPAWAVVSALWSDTGTYALARGIEMCVIATLAWATMAIVRTDAGLATVIARRFIRGFVACTVVLAGLGLVLGPVLVPASAENQERFTWIGAHPNGSALVLSIAIVMLLATGPARVGVPRPVWLATVGAFTLAMVANHSRGGLLALGAGVAVVLLVNGTALALWRHRFLRTAAIVVGAVTVSVFRDRLADYALRGRDADSLFSANGRIGLWRIGFDAMDSAFDWICGLGYGAARTVFVAELAWAKTAHNSILSLLVSVGIVGVVLGLAAVVATVSAARSAALPTSGPEGVALTGFAVALFVSALVSDVMAEPNIGLAGLYLIAALVWPAAEARRAQRPTAPNTVSHPEPAATSASHGDRSSTSGPT